MCALKFVFNAKSNIKILIFCFHLNLLKQCMFISTKVKRSGQNSKPLEFSFFLPNNLLGACTVLCSLWHSQAQQPELAPELAVPGSPRRNPVSLVVSFLLHSPNNRHIIFNFNLEGSLIADIVLYFPKDFGQNI